MVYLDMVIGGGVYLEYHYGVFSGIADIKFVRKCIPSIIEENKGLFENRLLFICVFSCAINCFSVQMNSCIILNYSHSKLKNHNMIM